MPDLRPSYEWEQTAQRSSDIVDPVITVRQLARFDSISRRALSRTDYALVFVTAKGEYDTFVPPKRPTRAERAGRAYRAVYEIDMGIRHLTLDQELPSAGDAFSFEAEVAVAWRVTAAERVVDSGLRDVPALIGPRIRQVMRAATRRFSVEHSAEAERAVQDALAAAPIAAAEGLQVTCAVQLSLDATTRAHQGLLRSIRNDRAVADPLHQLALLRALQEEEVIAQKAAFYRYHLDHGGAAGWALQLARHPDDLPNALQHLTAEQQQLVESQVELIEKLLNQDVFEKFQLEEPARLALQRITGILRGSAGAMPSIGAEAAPALPSQSPAHIAPRSSNAYRKSPTHL